MQSLNNELHLANACTFYLSNVRSRTARHIVKTKKIMIFLSTERSFSLFLQLDAMSDVLQELSSSSDSDSSGAESAGEGEEEEKKEEDTRDEDDQAEQAKLPQYVSRFKVCCVRHPRFCFVDTGFTLISVVRASR